MKIKECADQLDQDLKQPESAFPKSLLKNHHDSDGFYSHKEVHLYIIYLLLMQLFI